MINEASESIAGKMTAVYRDYYLERGTDRNDPLGNPEVLMQQLAADAALIRILRPYAGRRDQLRILDVGCGEGNTLLTLLGLGFHPSQLTGIDILQERLAAARERAPGASLVLGDASRMDFDSQSFDIVLESTIFLQITDDGLAQGIADEMIRVLKSGGSLILRDWRIGDPRDPTHRPLNRTRMTKLFRIGRATKIVSQERGSLIPPIGRFLSKRVPWAYFPIQYFCPFLVALIVTRLEVTRGE